MMGIMLSPEKLRRYPLFAGLDNSMLKAIAMISEEITVKKGEWIFHEGNAAGSVYVILSGIVDLKIPLKEEGIYYPSLSTLVEGDAFGWSALVDPYEYKLSAIAVKDVHLAKVDGVALCKLMAQNSAMGYLLMSRFTKIVGSRLHDLRVRFTSLVRGGRWQQIEEQDYGYSRNQS